MVLNDKKCFVIRDVIFITFVSINVANIFLQIKNPYLLAFQIMLMILTVLFHLIAKIKSGQSILPSFRVEDARSKRAIKLGIIALIIIVIAAFIVDWVLFK